MSVSPPANRRVSPTDAASLVIVRGGGRDAQVLMGRRRPRASFLPDVYVFPGGGLDREDEFAPPGAGLRPQVARKLTRRHRSTPVQTLAMTVARETCEETGLPL